MYLSNIEEQTKTYEHLTVTVLLGFESIHVIPEKYYNKWNMLSNYCVPATYLNN